MNILYIGAGFVGACSAAVSADSGHKTLAYARTKEKMDKLNSGDRDQIQSVLFEDGLGELLVRNKEKIEFTSDYSRVEKFLDECDAIFMCLPTPEIGETGESDLSFYFSAAEKLGEAIKKRNNGTQEKYIVIVNKSTVPVNMVDTTAETMDKIGVKNYGVVSNPEFLVEGKAVEGSIRPDRVVVGASSEKDFAIMRKIYERFYSSSSVKYIEVGPKEAAAGKLLANFTLFSKLAVCFDVIGRVCETFDDISFEKVRDVLTSDPRIGKWGFYDSLYAGGSCFIKDSRSLSHQLKDCGVDASLVNEVYLANKRQLSNFINRAENEAKFDWKGKVVALVGLAFKQDTNDIRNSSSIDLVKFLLEKNVAEIQAFDPAATENFKLLFPKEEKIKYKKSESDAISGSDIVIVATDWPQFRLLANQLLAGEKRPLIMDGRRILNQSYKDLQNAGFNIISVGSPFLPADKQSK